MSIIAIPTPGGGHKIVHDRAVDCVLVRVRPVGTLEWGCLTVFSEAWIPDLIEALQLAQRIANRPKPWEPFSVGAGQSGDTR